MNEQGAQTSEGDAPPESATVKSRDYRIFISYRREDAPDAADRLADRLSEHFGSQSVFIDIDTIDLGADFTEVIDDWVGSCDAFVVVIGPRWLDVLKQRASKLRLRRREDYVRLEIEAALRRGVPLVPVLIHGARMPAPDELPESMRTLSNRNALELSRKTFSHDIARLITALEASARLSARVRTPAPALPARETTQRPKVRPESRAPGQPEPAQESTASAASSEPAASNLDRPVLPEPPAEAESEASRDDTPLLGPADPPAAALRARLNGEGAVVDSLAAGLRSPGARKAIVVAFGAVATVVIAVIALAGGGRSAGAVIGPPIIIGGGPNFVAVGAGGVWATSLEGSVQRIDPSSDSVTATINAGITPQQVALGAGKVWVVNGQNQVVQIDAAAARTVGSTTVGKTPDAIAYGDNAVWVANADDGTVDRLDPSTGRVIGAPIAVGHKPDAIAVGDSAVWVANGSDGTVSRLDPTTGAVIGNPVHVGQAPQAVAVGRRWVWVANHDDRTLVRLDSSSGRVSGRPIQLADHPQVLTVGFHSIWVGFDLASYVLRVDDLTGESIGRVSGELSADGLSVGDGFVWASGGAGVVRIKP